MTALQNYYNTGTISVANGATSVFGFSTLWDGIVRAGDIFSAQGFTTRILSVTDNTHLTLANPWPGTTMVNTGPYEIRFPPPSADVTPSIRLLIESISGGTASQLESLTYANGDFLHYDTAIGGGSLTNITPTVAAAALQAVMNFSVGSAGSPGIRFAGFTDDGIYHVVDGVLGVSSNGVAVTKFSSAGVGILSTGAAHFTTLTTAEVTTADRVLSLSLGDANRSISLAGNITTAGAFTTSGAFALTLTQTAATNVTLPTTGTLATLAGTETLTNKVLNFSNNTVSNITTAMFAANVIDTDVTLATNSDTRIASQKAVKTYFDNAITGLQWKTAVVAATTASITLSAPQTIDGVSIIAGDRVLVKNQSTASQNGIYICAAGGWTRATDMDAAAEFPNATVFIQKGTANADTQWTCTTDATVIIGTTSIAFAQVAGAGTYTNGTGITLTGNAFSIANSAITYALMQNVAASRILGNPTGSPAAPAEISLGAALTFSSSVLQTAAMTGDVTTSANSFATTVAKIQSTTVSGTTGSGNVVFATAPTIAGGVITGLTGLAIRNAGTGAFDLTIAHNGTLTAGRTLTIDMGDTARAVTLGGNFQTSGNNIILTATGATNVTLPTTGTLATRAGTETFTNKTFDAQGTGNALSNLTVAMFATNIADVDGTLLANSDTRFATQKAIKTYVDASVNGFAWKPAVACASTANLTLSGEQTIDGIVTSASRVLVKNQSTGSQNGIYITAAGSWTRAPDCSTGAQIVWSTVMVEGGTTQARAQFTCSNQTITLGSTSIVYVQIAAGGASAAVYNKTPFSATAGQTVFNATYTPGYIDVWLNGSKLTADQYTATNGTSVTLGTAAYLNDIIEVIAWNVAGLASFIYNKTNYIATASQTTFLANYTVGYVDVWQNGVKLVPSAYTATNGTSVVLGSGATVSDKIEIVAWSVVNVTAPVYNGSVTFSDGGTWGTSGISPNSFALTGFINGLTLSTAGSSATFGIAAGQATDSAGSFTMILGSAYTKTTSSWAVGSATGALDTGSITNSTWYHVYLIKRPDTGVVDVLISTSASAPTMPTNYTLKRRIGAMKTNGSAQWIKFIQVGDRFDWDVSIADFSAVTPGVTTASSITLSVPSGVQVEAKVSLLFISGSTAAALLLSSLDKSDEAASSVSCSVYALTGAVAVQGINTTRTNTSAQVRMRVSTTDSSYYVTTFGWTDARGKS